MAKRMTVRQLIVELHKYDPNLPVFVRAPKSRVQRGLVDVEETDLVGVILDRKVGVGDHCEAAREGEGSPGVVIS
jgi:hypothetical protein